jgi:hypothetical protein
MAYFQIKNNILTILLCGHTIQIALNNFEGGVLMKRFVIAMISLEIILVSSCSLFRPKNVINFAPGYVSYTNGTVIKVADNDVMFKGAMANPEVSGMFTVKTDRDEIYTADSGTLFDVNDTSGTYRTLKKCSPASVGCRVTIYIYEGKVIGWCANSNSYLEKKYPKK